MTKLTDIQLNMLRSAAELVKDCNDKTLKGLIILSFNKDGSVGQYVQIGNISEKKALWAVEGLLQDIPAIKASLE